MAQTARSDDPDRDGLAGAVGPGLLDAQERRIARLVAAGLSDAEIATRLALDVTDVRAALAAIFGRLGLRSRTELALLAAGEPVGSTPWTAHPR